MIRSQSTPAPVLIGRVAGLGIVLLSFLVAMLLFTRNIDFPVSYHPDEASKVAQLLDPVGERNFNHPLLLLEATELLSDFLETGRTDRKMLIAGRRTSAILGALAAACAAGAGYLSRGLRGAFYCGFSVALCPALLVHSHYFKEDTALIAGLAASLLAARLLFSASSRGAQMGYVGLLGAACGCAAAAKYVGVVGLVPAVVALLAVGRRNLGWTFSALGVFLVAAALAAIAINADGFQSLFPPRVTTFAWNRLLSEVQHGMTGEREFLLSIPNAYGIRVSLSDLSPVMMVVLSIGLAYWCHSLAVSKWGLFLFASVLTWVVVLVCNTIPFSRYALPLTFLTYYVAGEVAAAISRWISHPAGKTTGRQSRWHRWGAEGAIAMIAITPLALRCSAMNQQFADDSRQHLRAWLADHLSANAHVLADGYTALGGTGDPWRFPDQKPLTMTLQVRQYAPDAIVSSLKRSLSVDHVYVAVAEPSYARFFVPGVRGQSWNEGLFQQRKAIYAFIFAHGELVWSATPSVRSNSYVNPELRLYRISWVRLKNLLQPPEASLQH